MWSTVNTFLRYKTWNSLIEMLGGSSRGLSTSVHNFIPQCLGPYIDVCGGFSCTVWVILMDGCPRNLNIVLFLYYYCCQCLLHKLLYPFNWVAGPTKIPLDQIKSWLWTNPKKKRLSARTSSLFKIKVNKTRDSDSTRTVQKILLGYSQCGDSWESCFLRIILKLFKNESLTYKI